MILCPVCGYGPDPDLARLGNGQQLSCSCGRLVCTIVVSRRLVVSYVWQFTYRMTPQFHFQIRRAGRSFVHTAPGLFVRTGLKARHVQALVAEAVRTAMVESVMQL